MKIQDHLDQTLEATQDLSLVAFGDLTTGMILNWSSRNHLPREVLDLLGEKAAESFALVVAAGMPEGADPDWFAADLVHVTETATHVFSRGADSDEDVVCAEATAGAPIEPLLRATEDLVYTIAEAS